MNQERIKACAISTAQPIESFAAARRPPPPALPADAASSGARCSRRLAVSPPTYYALKQAAATQAAPRTLAEVDLELATARAIHAIEIYLHG